MTTARQRAAGVPADAGERLREVHARLTSAVAELTQAENWQQMLRTAARLPSYSPHNVLLITSQCPHARAVAGFHTWKQLGRSVRKGEKGIAILAPIAPRATAAAAASPSPDVPAPTDLTAPAEDLRPRRAMSFRVVHVFDISQTEGPDLPELPRPTLLEGEAPPGLIDGLTSHVQQEGYQLLRYNFDVPHPGMQGPNGVTDFFARTVIVRPDLSDAQTTKTLAHELGHVLLHAPTQRPAGLTRPQAEVEAESVAFIVAEAHGLDTSRYTLPYVTGWAEGDLELLARSAERVISTSHTILTRTPPPATLELPEALRARTRDRDATRTGSAREVDTLRWHEHREPASITPTGTDRSGERVPGQGRSR
jgi:hypothetical protein